MTATQPDEMPAAFEQAFNTGDIEQVLALYESEAVLVPQPGQVVHGLAAIREALSRAKAANSPRAEASPDHGRYRAGLEQLETERKRT